jgi:hypothetical protein
MGRLLIGLQSKAGSNKTRRPSILIAASSQLNANGVTAIACTVSYVSQDMRAPRITLVEMADKMAQQ